jgi:hypothetical protein
MVPATPTPRVPPENTTLVPVPVSIHPVPPPAGRKSIDVKVTVTPSPVQFATEKVPITDAEAAGTKVATARIAKAKTPNCNFLIFLILRNWEALNHVPKVEFRVNRS